LAKEYNLRGSTGSDYHGPTGGWSQLGRFPLLPPDCKPIWELFV
ncbi:MAG: phosphatase, partial [Moraxellaceae bacterium]